MSAPVCTCGHLVVDDRRCSCIGRCPTCASEDCCAETWAIYERQQPLEYSDADRAYDTWAFARDYGLKP